MSNSDYHFELLLRQHHGELVREAAERRLARSLRQQPVGSAVAAWWQRVLDRVGQRRPSAPVRRVRLHTVGP